MYVIVIASHRSSSLRGLPVEITEQFEAGNGKTVNGRGWFEIAELSATLFRLLVVQQADP